MSGSGPLKDRTDLSEIETIDISGRNEQCSPIPNYPLGVHGSVAVYDKGLVTVCGGYNAELFYTDRCFQLKSPSDSWREIKSLPIPSSESKGSLIDGKWFISGGQDDPDVGTQTLIFDIEEKEYTLGPKMPDSKTAHCQVTVNATHVFFAGSTNLTYFLNWQTQEWIFVEDMPRTITFGAFGLLNNPAYGLGKKARYLSHFLF